MGCAGGKPRDAKDEKVQKTLSKDRAKDSEVKKLLLLGSGGSGKSTLFKQLQSIHGKGFNDRDRRQFKNQIHEQIMEAMKTMLMKCEDYIEDNDEAEDDEKKEDIDVYRVTEENQDHADLILSTRNNVDLNDEKIVAALHALWDDAAIKHIFGERNKICVPDSTERFMNNLDEVTTPEFTPTDEDLLLVRYRTTGMAEKTLIIEDNTFQICDVGGQRNERRKWIHFFDNVTAVIFVAALSCYDEVTFEDETANAMDEAIKVFEEQCNSPHFGSTAFILFLNKSDLFEEKIKVTPLTVCWANFKGQQTYESGIEFIQQKFEEKNNNPEVREVYSHITCATDKNNVRRVFNDVQHIVIQWSLEQSGLL